MKIRIFIFLALLLVLSHKPLIAGQVFIDIDDKLSMDIKNYVCVPYFQALKNGDVKTIIELSGGEIYEKYKVLSEKNSLYPQFLRDYYQGIEFDIGNMVKEGDDLIVNILLFYPNGNQGTFKIGLSETAKKSKSIRWQITRVIQ